MVDKFGSALFNAAKERATLIDATVICANNFISPKSLLKYLKNQQFDLIIFSWRKVLLDLYAFPRLQKNVSMLRKHTLFYVVIADYLGLENFESSAERSTLYLADGYYVTNKDLHEKYSKIFECFPPTGILHDLPNTFLLDLIYSSNSRPFNSPPKLIWIGNSKWGIRQGKRDHKGLKKVMLPLIDICRNHNNCMDITVIDSADHALSQEELFIRLRMSDFLIQTSFSEGTGLPLIEALGLETNVLSTDVGVAREIFHEPDSTNIVTADPEFIHERLHFLMEAKQTDNYLLRNRYLSYVDSAQKEILLYKRNDSISIPEVFSIQKRFKVFLLWLYRFSQ